MIDDGLVDKRSRTSYSLSKAFGYLTRNEVLALKKLVKMLPKNALVVNIGAGAGTGIIAMYEERPDITICTLDIRQNSPLGSLQSELNALEDCNLKVNHYQILQDSATVTKKQITELTGKDEINMVFIDGDHSAEGVRGDIHCWRPVIAEGGILAVHDYTTAQQPSSVHGWPEVRKAVDEILKPELEEILHMDSTIAFYTATDTSNNIHVIGFTKSGNVWLSRMIADILDSPIVSGKSKPSVADGGYDRSGKYIIRQTHTKKKPNTDKIVYLYRDPRDVMVSVMHYWGYDNLTDWYDERNAWDGWEDHLHTWLNEHAWENTTSYEKLHSQPEVELHKILVAMDINPNPNCIKNAIENQEFSYRRQDIEDNPDKYSYNAGIQLKHMRKGIVGDWKNYYTRDLARKTQEHWGYWLQRLGYENDPEWWKKC